MKILCFAPYAWRINQAYESTILQAMAIRGVDVHYVLCDALFPVCDIFSLATRPKEELSCSLCEVASASMATRAGLPFEWLGRYLSPQDARIAQGWIARLGRADLASAQYGDWPLAHWGTSSANTYLRMSRLEVDRPEVERVYRDFLHTTLLACMAISSLLEESRPDVMLTLNGRLSLTRVALELARKRGIPVVCHEVGRRPGTLALFRDTYCQNLAQYRELWAKWGEIPLRADQLDRIIRYMTERRTGGGLTGTAFSPPPQALDEVYQTLSLAPDRPVWVLYTSSDDEVAALPEWKSAFAGQLEWLRRSIAVAAAHPERDLVIRVHPNTGGKRSVGANLQQLEEIRSLVPGAPANVRFVWPDDPISSYSLADLATVALVYQSTLGMELSCMGKVVVCAGWSYVFGLPFVRSVTDHADYERILGELQDLPIQFTSDDVRRFALRFAYGVYFRWPIEFSLVEFVDPKTTELRYRNRADLAAGRDAGLDRVLSILLEGQPICPSPTEADRQATDADEARYLAGYERTLAG